MAQLCNSCNHTKVPIESVEVDDQAVSRANAEVALSSAQTVSAEAIAEEGKNTPLASQDLPVGSPVVEKEAPPPAVPSSVKEEVIIAVEPEKPVEEEPETPPEPPAPAPEEKSKPATEPTTPASHDPPCDPDAKPAEPAKPRGFFKKQMRRLLDQEPHENYIMARSLGVKCQACCAVICAVILLGIAAWSNMAVGKIKEVVVEYKFPDESLEFTVDEDMTEDVNMWYDLPGVILTHKKYADNVDPDVVKQFIMGKKSCSDFEDQAAVRWRRTGPEAAARAKLAKPFPTEDKFTKLVGQIPDGLFKPCGAQSLAMFTDEYQLDKNDDGVYTNIKLDQSEIAIETDLEIFEKRYDKPGEAAPDDPLNQPYALDDKQSWVADKDFWQHYIVWMRNPATTRATHLWATIKGGLKKGKYRLTFTQNSAIWTEQWGVEKKQVILSTSHVLGSKSACQQMFLFSLVFGVIEAIVAVAFIIGSFVKR